MVFKKDIHFVIHDNQFLSKCVQWNIKFKKHYRSRPKI